MTLVTPEIVFAIAALVFFVQAGNRLGLETRSGWQTILIAHVVFNASVVALVVRAASSPWGRVSRRRRSTSAPARLSTFRQVTLPRLAPAILAGGLLAFTFSFDDFITSFFVTGPTSETLPIYIWGSSASAYAGDQRDGRDDARFHARRRRRRVSRAAGAPAGPRAGRLSGV